MQEINDKGMDASTKEKNLLTVLKLANEMLERGYEFGMIDLYKSEGQKSRDRRKKIDRTVSSSTEFRTERSETNRGSTEKWSFSTRRRSRQSRKVSKTLIEYMTDNGVEKIYLMKISCRCLICCKPTAVHLR